MALGHEVQQVGESTDRILGRLEGRLAALEDRADRHDLTVTSIHAKLDAISAQLNQATGGFRIAHGIMGVVLVIGGWIAHEFHFWTLK